MPRRTCPYLLPLLLTLIAARAAFGDPAGTAHFETRIRPVLVRQCYGCHSGPAPKAGLALDTPQGLRKGGKSGPVLVEGRPEESLLVRTLRQAPGAPQMPPGGRLPAAVIADFAEWIRQGAPDPREQASPTGRAGPTGMTVEEGRRFWSFRPPVRRGPPPVRQAGWPRGAVDRFILSALERRGLAPSRDAERHLLLRRIYFDLVGLPPTPAEVDAFETGSSPEALAQVVDRLLASPHFGERWGRHWLDSARYADSNGRDRNMFFFHAWRYRDYVIDAFNRDKPYDQFLREQIAGDLLPAPDPERRDQQRIATGFLALGPKTFGDTKPEVFRMELIDEQIDVIGRTVLGLSVACARCHDHKFDPIPTRDYYALAGILRSTQTLYGYGPMGIAGISHSEWQPVGPDADRLGPPATAYYERLQSDHLVWQRARSDRYRVVRRLADAKNQLSRPGADEPALRRSIAAMEAEIKDWDARVAALEAKLFKLMDEPPALPGWAMAVRDRETPEECRVHVRGDVTTLGEVVPRGVLQVVAGADRGQMPSSGSGRRELADWLASRANPLTARVFVNRVWQHLFGRGLVATPDDFGVKGAAPSHPELLDFLAYRFMDGGWSTKRLIRELVLSRAYAQSAKPQTAGLASDPENTLLWRAAPRRLDAEAYRDAVLAVCGALDPKPPSEPFLARVHPRRNEEWFSFKPAVTPDQFEDDHRSVYQPVLRGVLPELFQLFDFAAPDRPVAARAETTVPAQALFLLNSPWMVRHAERLAERVAAESGSSAAAEPESVRRLYLLAFSRPPSPSEAARALAYLEAPEELLPPRPPKPGAPAPASPDPRRARWISFCQLLLASSEFRFLR
jgi:hypothetical protein